LIENQLFHSWQSVRWYLPFTTTKQIMTWSWFGSLLMAELRRRLAVG
jgi:hypothetical protein